MKTFFKSLAVFSVVFCMTFSPALMGMANAGGINYEGFGSYKKNNSGGYDDNNHGAMLKFSFGGPKDYKKSSSLQDIYKASLTQDQKIFLGLGVGLVVFLLIMHEEDEDCVSSSLTNGHEAKVIYDTFILPGSCEPSGRVGLVNF